jgi:hypothetical protein
VMVFMVGWDARTSQPAEEKYCGAQVIGLVPPLDEPQHYAFEDHILGSGRSKAINWVNTMGSPPEYLIELQFRDYQGNLWARYGDGALVLLERSKRQARPRN